LAGHRGSEGEIDGIRWAAKIDRSKRPEGGRIVEATTRRRWLPAIADLPSRSRAY